MSSLVDVFTGPAGFVLELAERWRAGASGMLEVRRAGVTTLLYVDEGVPVFAESSGLSETLGRVLLREGKLDEAQYAQVVRRVTENLVDAEPMRFGEAAVSLGFVNAMQIQEALASQVRRRLLACAGPGPQERHWLQDASIVEDIGSYPQDVPKLIAILVEALTDEERAGLFRMLGQPSPREPLHEAASYYGLEPAEARALRPGQRLPEGHPLTLRLALLDAMTERVPLEPVPLEMFDADAPPTTARRPSARAPRPGVHVHTDIQTEEVLWAPRRAPPAQESGEVVLPMAPSPVSVEVADGASTTSEVIALPLPDFDVAPGDPVEARFAFVPPEGRRRADAASVEADSEGSASSDEGWRRDAASVEGRSEGGEEGWRREVASVEACSERSTPSEEDVTESTQVTRRADLPWTSPSGPSTDARTASARVADEEVATHAERLGAREDDERAGAPKREVATKELAAR
ncbi:MAG: hypothetical protein KF901_19070, partial [Myxococcales bacterium]|nr:hypothetical protein [Myxococcales bacterium]